MNDWLTTLQAMELTGIRLDALRAGRRSGRIRTLKEGRKVYVNRPDLLDYLRVQNLTDDIFQAEWHHFTKVAGMSNEDAAHCIARGYGMRDWYVRLRARRMGILQEVQAV